MIRNGKWIALATLFSLSAAQPGYTQLVRISPGGGVSVRAPFVRVEVDPFGGTYVRAPFTSVYSPGNVYGYYDGGYYGPDYGYGPSYAPYALPGDGGVFSPEQAAWQDVSEMDWQRLRQYLDSAAGRLESDLEQFATAGSWKRYLQPGTLQDLMAEPAEEPPTPATADRLRRMLERYEMVSGTDEFQQIAALESFQPVHQALFELAYPAEHQRQLVSSRARRLEEDLLRWDSGEQWRQYLLLSELNASGNDQAAMDDTDQLQWVLHRFDRVRDESQYARIAELASFQEVHQQLERYVAMLSDPAADRPLEELPIPEAPIELNAPANYRASQ